MQMAVQALEAFSICSGVNSGLLLNGSTWIGEEAKKESNKYLVQLLIGQKRRTSLTPLVEAVGHGTSPNKGQHYRRTFGSMINLLILTAGRRRGGFLINVVHKPERMLSFSSLERFLDLLERKFRFLVERFHQDGVAHNSVR